MGRWCDGHLCGIQNFCCILEIIHSFFSAVLTFSSIRMISTLDVLLVCLIQRHSLRIICIFHNHWFLQRFSCPSVPFLSEEYSTWRNNVLSPSRPAFCSTVHSFPSDHRAPSTVLPFVPHTLKLYLVNNFTNGLPLFLGFSLFSNVISYSGLYEWMLWI